MDRLTHHQILQNALIKAQEGDLQTAQNLIDPFIKNPSQNMLQDHISQALSIQDKIIIQHLCHLALNLEEDDCLEYLSRAQNL